MQFDKATDNSDRVSEMAMPNPNTDNQSSDNPLISIVIPSYDEGENVRKIYDELKNVLTQLDVTWEIIFADDGSKDGTWAEVQKIHQRDACVKGIRFSRNFGHQYALFAGMVAARGQAVISMDGDLQHPPPVIKDLIDEWRKGNKIVHTIRVDDEDTSLFKRSTGNWYYALYALWSGVNIEPGMADFRLLDRQVVDILIHLPEEGLFLRGLVHWIGFPSAKVKFQCQKRYSGQSKYTLRRMISFAWVGITSFSNIPLRWGIFIGMATSVLAFAQLAYAIFVKLYTGTAVPGWASAVSIISLLFGILFILIGVLGEYLGRVLIEVRGRPRFLVREQVGIEERGREHPLKDWTHPRTFG
jgi:dolichol-phosphate mannosyltransferase